MGARTARPAGGAAANQEHVTENRITRALRSAEARPDFLNLINTNFHDCGLAPPPSAITDAATDLIHDPARRGYRPDSAGLPILRESVARYAGRCGRAVDPSSIIVTASASESYRHLFTALCAPGETVLLPCPGYPLFEEIAARCGLSPVFYRLRFESGWRIDPDEVSSLITADTGALVLISPNNPTGAIVDEPVMREISRRCAERRVKLIVDEVFGEYRYDGLPSPDAATFSINGVSKLLASPDLKVSWIVLGGPRDIVADARERLEIENDLYLSASPITQFVAARLLDSGTGMTHDFVAEVRRRRDVMLGSLADLSARHPGILSWVPPPGGVHLPLVFTRPPGDRDDEQIAVDLLERYGLSVHPGYLYGEDEHTMVVLSYLVPPETIRDGVSRIDAYLSSPGTMRAALR